MVKDSRKELGRSGEDFAVSFLESSGYEIIERNFRTRSGEADIIASKENTMYFIEVKTRKRGTVREDYSEHQRSRLRELAEIYLERAGLDGQVSFNVIEVIGDPETGNPLIEMIDDNYSM